MALKPRIVTQEMVKDLALSLEEGGKAAAKALLFAYAGEAPDYSLEECWVQVPEVTKNVDTFYIYSTSYCESSFAEGAPDYAPLDNPEMVYGALAEYVTNASAFEDSTNVFVPFYRQSGIRYAAEVRDKIGDVGADAQVVLRRGVVLTHADAAYADMTELFGPASFHENEYELYYNNIKDNAAKRIAAYRAAS